MYNMSKWNSISSVYIYLFIFTAHNYLLLLYPWKADPLSSPLEAAAEKGHTEIVEKLIAAGAVINYQDKVWDLHPVRYI